MGFTTKPAALFSNASPDVKLNAITVTVTMDVNTDVTTQRRDGGGSPTWTERVTQAVSWTKVITVSKVDFSAQNLPQFYDNGGGPVRSTIPYTDLGLDVFAFFKACCIPWPLMLYFDDNYSVNTPSVTWQLINTATPNTAFGGGPGGDQWFRDRSFTGAVNNDWHQVNAASSGYTGSVPANTDDTDPINVQFYNGLYVGLPSAGSLAKFQFYLTTSGSAKAPDWSSIFDGAPKWTDDRGVHPYTWGDPTTPGTAADFGGTITLDVPAPTGTDVTVAAWTYKLTCEIVTE